MSATIVIFTGHNQNNLLDPTQMLITTVVASFSEAHTTRHAQSCEFSPSHNLARQSKAIWKG